LKETKNKDDCANVGGKEKQNAIHNNPVYHAMQNSLVKVPVANA
jgi:hypothetical protein